MSLNLAKETAIIQWYNSLTLPNGLENLAQLADGSRLHKICIEFIPETKLSKLPVKENGVLLSPEYTKVKQLLDDYFQMESDKLIDYSQCTKEDKLELAKLAILTLSVVVLQYVQAHDPAVRTLTLLDPQTQMDIEECLNMVVNASNILSKPEMHRILSRPAKCKRSLRNSVSPSALTPVNNKQSRRKFPQEIQEDIISSPLQSFLISPKTQEWAIVLNKNKEVASLKCELYKKEYEVENLRLQIEELQKDLGKTKKESNLQKKNYQKWQEDAEQSEKDMKELFEKEKKNLADKVEELKKELCLLKEENKQLAIDLDKSQQKKVSIASTPKDAHVNDKMHELEVQLIEKSKYIEDLEKNIENLMLDIQHKNNRWNIHQERLRHELEELQGDKIPEPCGEQVSDILETEYQQLVEMCHELQRRSNQDDLTIKNLKDENSFLKKRLEIKEDQLKFRDQEISKNKDLLSKNKDLLSYYQTLLKKVVIKNDQEDDDENITKHLCSVATMTDNVVSSESSKFILVPSSTNPRANHVSESVGLLWSNEGQFSQDSGRIDYSNFMYTKANKNAIQIAQKNTCSEAETSNVITIADIYKNIEEIFPKYGMNGNCRFQNADNKERIPEDVVVFLQMIQQFFFNGFSSYKSAEGVNIKISPKCKIEPCEFEGNLLNANSAVKKENSELKEKLIKCMEIEKKQKEELHNLRQSYEEKEKEIGCLIDNLKKCSFEYCKLKKKYNSLKTLTTNLETTNKDLLEKYNTQFKSLNRLMEDKKNMHAEMTREISREKDINDVLSAQNANLVYVRSTLNSKIKYLTEELEAEKKKNLKLNEDLLFQRIFDGNNEEKKEVIHNSFMEEISALNNKNECSKYCTEGKRFTSDGEWNGKTRLLNDIRESDSFISNKSIYPFFNKSLHGTLSLYNDDEKEILNHSSIMERKKEILSLPFKFDNQRLKELNRRNTLCLPHLRSSYPVELQGVSPAVIISQSIGEPSKQNLSESRKLSTNGHHKMSHPLPKKRKISGSSTSILKDRQSSTPMKKYTKVLRTPSSLRHLIHIRKSKASNVKTSFKK